ncbi:MAG: hypothetical protein O2800_00805 [Planctomycetota bacterium]|nr:hypothetical protein [Planctomycetota bacterium]
MFSAQVSLLILPLLFGAVAHGQSEADLRKENDRLKERVLECETEIAALLRRIQLLEESARTAPSTRPLAEPAPAPSTVPTSESTPSAQLDIDPTLIPEESSDPDEIIHYERLRYIHVFGGNPLSKGSSSTDITRFQQQLDGWTVSEARLWRKTTARWTLRVTRSVRARDGHWTVEAAQPIPVPTKGEKQLTTRVEPVIPIQFTLKPRQGDSIRDALEGNGLVSVEGFVRLNLRMDEERPSAGAFSHQSRPFIGPYCDAVIGLDVQTITITRKDSP